MKTCNVCQKSLELFNFYKEKANKGGFSHCCKNCKNKATADWRMRNKEEWNAYMRKHRAEHPLAEKTKLQMRSRVLKNRYGITLAQYEEMLAKQNNCCAICGKNSTKQLRNFCVDHHHGTGKVRKLLCDGCNVAIAVLDNPELLAKAQAYLAAHS